ncbi:hypothetical protein TNCV_1144731 [Trichonephila clavipes]|nr:hypothetical protein TNCV_1144731 [Trichonephila clavipes]
MKDLRRPSTGLSSFRALGADLRALLTLADSRKIWLSSAYPGPSEPRAPGAQWINLHCVEPQGSADHSLRTTDPVHRHPPFCLFDNSTCVLSLLRDDLTGRKDDVR